MGRFTREVRQAVMPAPTRELLAGHATRHTLDGARWRRTSRGFYVPATQAPLTPAQRIVDVARILPPGATIGGWAAAHALGADLHDGVDDHTMQLLPVPVYLPPGLHRHDAPGVQYRRRTRRWLPSWWLGSTSRRRCGRRWTSPAGRRT